MLTAINCICTVTLLRRSHTRKANDNRSGDGLSVQGVRRTDICVHVCSSFEGATTQSYLQFVVDVNVFCHQKEMLLFFKFFSQIERR